jgi:hypothetical protein
MSTDHREPTPLTTQQPRSASEREGATNLTQMARTGAHAPRGVRRLFVVDSDGVWYAPMWTPLAFVAALLLLALVVNLVVSALDRGSPLGATTHHMPMSTAMPSGTMMQLPPYAKDMKVAVTSPANGTMVTANMLTVAVAASGYTLTCDLAGKPDQQGTGHYHVLLDKALVNMFCTPTATISMQNVSPGMHTLTVVPALNDHSEVEENGKSIMIDYEPKTPLPTITDATFASKPSIMIISPKNGDTVSGAFDIVVQVTNYNLSCDLMGKPDVAGYGHWHANLDTMSGPMMGMGTMLGMSCSTTFHATTAGLKAGETHTIIALLTDNGHAPLNPAVDSQVTVKIGG